MQIGHISPDDPDCEVVDVCDDESTTPAPHEENVEGLGDLYELAFNIFQTWHGGREMEWAEHAWLSVRRAGLTQYETEVDRARVVCRLLALATLAREFYARARGEGEPGEFPFDAADVVGTYPRIDPFVLGQLAEREGVDADPEVGYEFEEGSPTYALRTIVSIESRAVARVLKGDWGDTKVFASLWASAGDSAEYPLGDEVLWEIVNTDVTGEKMDGLQWVVDGMAVG